MLLALVGPREKKKKKKIFAPVEHHSLFERAMSKDDEEEGAVKENVCVCVCSFVSLVGYLWMVGIDSGMRRWDVEKFYGPVWDRQPVICINADIHRGPGVPNAYTFGYALQP